jgi:hypothetical protein
LLRQGAKIQKTVVLEIGDPLTIIPGLGRRKRAANTYAYLADVLAKIVNGHPNSAIDDLLPWAYAPPQPLKAVA